MLVALKTGDVTKAQALAEAGISPLRYQYYGDKASRLLDDKPLVYHAIEQGHSLEMIQFLVAQKANPHAAHRMVLIRTVPGRYISNITTYKKVLMTPLYMAAKKGNLQSVQFLLSLLPIEDSPAVLDCHSKDGQWHQTPLLKALTKYDGEIVEALLAHKACVNTRNEQGLTPLMQAAYRGNPKVVSLLLDAKADIHSRTDYGYGVAYYALHGGLAVLDNLLALKAVPRMIDEKPQDALVVAAGGYDVRVVKRLLANGVGRLNAKGGPFVDTPVQRAGRSGRADILLFLMRSKANPGVKNFDDSPLRKAEFSNSQASEASKLKISYLLLMFKWRASSKWHEASSKSCIKQLQTDLMEAGKAGDAETLDAKLTEASKMLGSDVSGLKLYFGIKYKHQAWIDELSEDEEAISLSALYAKGMFHVTTEVALLKLESQRKRDRVSVFVKGDEAQSGVELQEVRHQQ